VSLKADLSHLPPAAPSGNGSGRAPDASPRFVGVLAEAWATDGTDDKPTALGTRVRHSDAGKCARAIAYTAAGIPKSDPMDLTGTWNTHLGTLIHEEWQRALAEVYGDALIECKVGLGADMSGHIDAVIYDGGNVIVYELKTIGGFGFKAAVGKMGRGKPPEGPKPEHVAQAAINGLAFDAHEVVIGYLAKECISVNAAGDMDPLGRFAAEWTFTREEFEPIALAEQARLEGIVALVDKGELAARKFPPGTLPPGAEIIDPTTGRWEVRDEGAVVDTGSWWACGYCSHQTVCVSTEPGRIPVESVTKVEVSA